MNEFHSPGRQENYLRQGLAQDKRAIGLFLSAGCPLAVRVGEADKTGPLIPDIDGLTEIVCKRISADKTLQSLFATVLQHFEADQRQSPNVEDILSHIRSLRTVAGKDRVRGLNATELDALDTGICNVIIGVMDRLLPSQDTPYHKLAAWVGGIQRMQAVELFTTNYDLLLEQALEEHRVAYFDGFVGSCRTFFDPHAIEQDSLPVRWARLWKLHGSINWRQDPSGAVSRGEKIEEGQRRVIHPSHLKYDESRRMPYLAMIDRLKAFLRQPSALMVTCGYSFRDEHLNEVLVQGLQGNPTTIVFALLFGKLENYPKAIKLATSRANLSLLAQDEAIIGTRRGKWIECPVDNAEKATVAVDWVTTNGANGQSFAQSQFKLGDFARFGAFVGELLGVVHAETEAKSGE